jgi:hypothetical protein
VLRSFPLLCIDDNSSRSEAQSAVAATVAIDGDDMKQWNTPQTIQEKLQYVFSSSTECHTGALRVFFTGGSKERVASLCQRVARRARAQVCAYEDSSKSIESCSSNPKHMESIQLETKHSCRDQHPSAWPQMYIYATCSTLGGGLVCPVVRA